MNLDGFSKRLKGLMELDGISNRALSLKINVDRTSVRFWLSGRFYPRYDTLMKLASYFSVRIDSLVCIEEREKDVEELTVVKTGFCEDVQKHFFTKVTAFMAEQKLTRYALAKKLNIDQKAFTNWLNKGSMPETATIIRLASIMGASIDELLGRER